MNPRLRTLLTDHGVPFRVIDHRAVYAAQARAAAFGPLFPDCEVGAMPAIAPLARQVQAA